MCLRGRARPPCPRAAVGEQQGEEVVAVAARSDQISPRPDPRGLRLRTRSDPRGLSARSGPRGRRSPSEVVVAMWGCPTDRS